MILFEDAANDWASPTRVGLDDFETWIRAIPAHGERAVCDRSMPQKSVGYSPTILIMDDHDHRAEKLAL
jgi:hypothetical protein